MFNPKIIISVLGLIMASLIVLYSTGRVLDSSLDDPSLASSQSYIQDAGTPVEKAIVNEISGPVTMGSTIRNAIKLAVLSGISVDTIVLLLLLPVVATFIAAVRHLIGIRGFGILLPAALSIVFVSIGPVVGIGLFLVIVLVSTGMRFGLRSIKVRLQYLPRMALMLWAVCVVVLGLLFVAPLVKSQAFANVSIFPVLILVLLSEDFTRVQIGKSVKTAVTITAETLFVGTLSYFILTWQQLQVFAVVHPEILLITVSVIDIAVGRYIGLRFLEFWRFRKLIKTK